MAQRAKPRAARAPASTPTARPRPLASRSPKDLRQAQELLRDLLTQGYYADRKLGTVAPIEAPGGGWAILLSRGGVRSTREERYPDLGAARRGAVQIAGLPDPGAPPAIPEGPAYDELRQQITAAERAVGQYDLYAAGREKDLAVQVEVLRRLRRDLTRQEHGGKVPARLTKQDQADEERRARAERAAELAARYDQRKQERLRKEAQAELDRGQELADRSKLFPSLAWSDQFWAATEVLHPKIQWSNADRERIWAQTVRLYRAHKGLKPGLAAQSVAVKCEIPTSPTQAAPIDGEAHKVLPHRLKLPPSARGSAVRPPPRPDLPDRIPSQLWQVSEHLLRWVEQERRYLQPGKEGLSVMLVGPAGGVPREDWDGRQAIVDFLAGDEADGEDLAEHLRADPRHPQVELLARPRAGLGARTEVAAAPHCDPDKPECGYQVQGGVCTISARLSVADSGSQKTQRIPARYCLVPIGELLTSNQPLQGYTRTKGYPVEAQERDYGLLVEQNKVQSIADDYDPALIFNTAPGAIDGVPVADQGRRVLGGNGRTMGTALVYAGRGGVPKDTPKRYLADHAHEFGFTRAQVEQFDEPMLVRTIDVPDDPRSLAEWSRRLNTSLSQQLDAVRLAVSRARFVDEATLRALAQSMSDDETLSQFLSSQRSRPFVQSLQRGGVIDGRAAATYLGPDGLLNEAGRDLVEDLLVAILLPDAQIISAYGRGPVGVLARGAPYLVLAGAGDPAFDLRDPLRLAVRDRITMASQGRDTVGPYLQQGGLFSGPVGTGAAVEGNERATILLYVLTALDRSPRRFMDFTRRYSELSAANPSAQGGLFASEKRGPLDALREAAASAKVELPTDERVPAAPPLEKLRPLDHPLHHPANGSLPTEEESRFLRALILTQRPLIPTPGKSTWAIDMPADQRWKLVEAGAFPPNETVSALKKHGWIGPVGGDAKRLFVTRAGLEAYYSRHQFQFSIGADPEVLALIREWWTSPPSAAPAPEPPPGPDLFSAPPRTPAAPAPPPPPSPPEPAALAGLLPLARPLHKDPEAAEPTLPQVQALGALVLHRQPLIPLPGGQKWAVELPESERKKKSEGGTFPQSNTVKAMKDRGWLGPVGGDAKRLYITRAGLEAFDSTANASTYLKLSAEDKRLVRERMKEWLALPPELLQQPQTRKAAAEAAEAAPPAPA